MSRKLIRQIELKKKQTELTPNPTKKINKKSSNNVNLE